MSPRSARPGPNRSGAGVNLDSVHSTEVNDEAALDRLNRDRSWPPLRMAIRAPVPPQRERSDDVGGVQRACDQRRMPIDHPVLDVPGVFVARVVRADQVALEGRLEGSESRGIDAGLRADFGCHVGSPCCLERLVAGQWCSHRSKSVRTAFEQRSRPENSPKSRTHARAGSPPRSRRASLAALDSPSGRLSRTRSSSSAASALRRTRLIAARSASERLP